MFFYVRNVNAWGTTVVTTQHVSFIQAVNVMLVRAVKTARYIRLVYTIKVSVITAEILHIGKY
jgi:hypothetical protein